MEDSLGSRFWKPSDDGDQSSMAVVGRRLDSCTMLTMRGRCEFKRRGEGGGCDGDRRVHCRPTTTTTTW